MPVIVANIRDTATETDHGALHDASCRCGHHDHSEEAEARLAPVTHLEVPTLGALLKTLVARGLSTVLVEGGATVASAFLAQDLVDRIILYVSDTIVGDGGLESPLTPSDMPASFTFLGSAPVGPDRRYEYERSA